jgi:hypothetical protein
VATKFKYLERYFSLFISSNSGIDPKQVLFEFANEFHSKRFSICDFGAPGKSQIVIFSSLGSLDT